ncbi:hypothetical protein PLUTE_b0020 [Pseudoalteromonas luteoviolacea DSM 6061]|nr:hypothetical protein [Pseudoalteromonas luteoviolacea DSM 6061]
MNCVPSKELIKNCKGALHKTEKAAKAAYPGKFNDNSSRD